VKLTKEDIVTLKVLRQTGETNQAIAARLGISEGAVRYHLKRQSQAATDGRRKVSLIAQLQLVEVAFKRLGGIAAVNRIDNLKTGVASGRGVWGKINESYSGYARTMGFHVDPHEARQPQQKGKVERRVGAFKQMDVNRVFDSLEKLQAYTDEAMQRDSVVRKCPVTGQSVHETGVAIFYGIEFLVEFRVSDVPEVVPLVAVFECGVSGDGFGIERVPSSSSSLEA
jgi:predicted transcriptional regulator